MEIVSRGKGETGVTVSRINFSFGFTVKVLKIPSPPAYKQSLKEEKKKEKQKKNEYLTVFLNLIKTINNNKKKNNYLGASWGPPSGFSFISDAFLSG